MRAKTTRSASLLFVVSMLVGLSLALSGLALALGPGEIAVDPALEEYLPGCSYRVGEDQVAVCTLVGVDSVFAASDEAFAPGCGGGEAVAQSVVCWPAAGPTLDPVMEFAPGCNY